MKKMMTTTMMMRQAMTEAASTAQTWTCSLLSFELLLGKGSTSEYEYVGNEQGCEKQHNDVEVFDRGCLFGLRDDDDDDAVKCGQQAAGTSFYPYSHRQ